MTWLDDTASHGLDYPSLKKDVQNDVGLDWKEIENLKWDDIATIEEMSDEPHILSSERIRPWSQLH